MSVSWNVLPIVPEILDWLGENGFETDIQKTRYPSLDELFIVLESFGLPIQKEKIAENTVGIHIGEAHSPQYAYILGDIKDNGFAFEFFGSMCEEKTMLEILKRLCQRYCNALVIYESASAIPLIIDSQTNIEEAVEEWNRRIRGYLNESIVRPAYTQLKDKKP